LEKNVWTFSNIALSVSVAVVKISADPVKHKNLKSFQAMTAIHADTEKKRTSGAMSDINKFKPHILIVLSNQFLNLSRSPKYTVYEV